MSIHPSSSSGRTLPRESPLVRFPGVVPPSRGQRLAVPELPTGALHIWGFSLMATPLHANLWAESLSSEEIGRARRFASISQRAEYVVGHGVLRHLLAAYCAELPPGLRIDSSPAGKPFLAHEKHRHIRFNLSHSHGRALVGISRNIELGIDVEQVRPEVEVRAIANRFFYGAEIEAIRAADDAAQRDVFFAHWVAKEAVLKAEGIGFGFPLDQFGVRFTSDGQRAAVHSSGPTELTQAWSVQMLSCGNGWAGAVAAPGQNWALSLHHPQSPTT